MRTGKRMVRMAMLTMMMLRVTRLKHSAASHSYEHADKATLARLLLTSQHHSTNLIGQQPPQLRPRPRRQRAPRTKEPGRTGPGPGECPRKGFWTRCCGAGLKISPSNAFRSSNLIECCTTCPGSDACFVQALANGGVWEFMVQRFTAIWCFSDLGF